MKKVMSVIFLLYSCLAGAQIIESSKDIVFSFSEPFDGMSTYMGYPLGYKASFVINGEINSFQMIGGSYKFLKYSGSTLNETQKNEVPKDEAVDIEGVERLGERFYYFYSKWDRPKKSEQLFVREIDFEKGGFAGQERKLYASSGKLHPVDIYKAMMMAYPKFQRIKSIDENTLMVAYTWQLKKKVRKTTEQQIGMHVYDEKMNEQWHRVVKIPHISNDVAIMDYAVSKDNDAYILVQIFGDKSEERKDKTGSYLIVYCVNGKTGNVTGTDISMDAVFVVEAGLSENPNGQIVAYGMYGKSKSRLAHGVFATTLKDNGELIKIQKNDIPISIITQNTKATRKARIERTAMTSDWGLNNLALKNVIFGIDGSVSLIAEELSVGNSTDWSYGINHGPIGGYKVSSSEKSKIKYGDVLIAHIAPDSAQTRFSSIPKKQMASVRGEVDRNQLKRTTFMELGFAFINKQSSPYVIFIDNIKNFNLPDDEIPHEHRSGLGGFLTGYKINPKTGEMENIVFFDLKDAQGRILKQFSVSQVFQLSEDEIAIEFASEVPKKNVMVKIKLP